MLTLVFFALGVSGTLSQTSEFPSCGDCWCVPSNNGLGECPSWQPPSYSNETASLFLQKQPNQIMTLPCNPYEDSSCATVPAQEFVGEEDAVCAYVYTSASDETCSKYDIVSFASADAAVAANAFVTHAGSCGVCSTAQDLAIYLMEDFTSAGKVCATKGLFNEQKGLECYMELGLSEECARIWNYDGIFDGQACGSICTKELTAPNNGPAPACELNDCLQCDEDKAGPIFSQFAGRTRRRSGLQSEIVRPCDSIAQIVHDPLACNA